MNHPLQCRCGTLKGFVENPKSGNRVICYCRDCQAFAYFLGRANDVLDQRGLFEVSTPNWSALATVVGSLNYINHIGIDAIAHHRAPLLRRLNEQLPQHSFRPLTPPEFQGPYVVFSREGAGDRFRRRLHEAQIYVTLTRNKIRISPSVYNDMDDIDRLLKILCA